jgi:hypothetical protein
MGYAKQQVLFNALECYLKAFCLERGVGVPDALMGSHDLGGIISRCKTEDDSFLSWLELLDKADIDFDFSRRKYIEATDERKARMRQQYSDPEFYMLLHLNKDLKYGALNKDFRLKERILITGDSQTVVRIISEIRQSLALNGGENCLLQNMIDSKMLPPGSIAYLRRYMSE